MNFNQRPYQNRSDLSEISALIRRTYTLAPGLNSWSFALYDIWSQRKLGDQAVFGITDWQQDIRLWEGNGTGLAGAVVFRDPAFVKLILHPENLDLISPMLDWVEARFVEKALDGKALVIESIATNPYFENMLAARRYKSETGYYTFREKDLTASPPEVVKLPPGFAIRHIQTRTDLQKFHHGTELVFNFPDNPQVYQILRQAPSFVPELDLIILSPGGEIACFGSVWLDQDLSLAEFEPVGTVPEFRQLGFGRALIAEACNRLRDFGCQKVTVMSWSESPAVNALYEKSGFLPKTRKNYWKWNPK
jgi:ribosomal protein S18 acetylase RimI-like enzyme